MTDVTPLALRSALVGVLVLSGAAGAQALTVTRCNILKDGVYRPALVIEKAGEKSVHHIGDDGLTRSMVFDAALAVAWAEATFGADPGQSTAFGRCGRPSSGGGGTGKGGAGGSAGGGGGGCF